MSMAIFDGVEDFLKTSKSSMFVRLIRRFLDKKLPNTEISCYNGEEQGKFEFWIPKAVEQALDKHPEMYVVSGEFNYKHWDKLGGRPKGRGRIAGRYDTVIDCLYDAFHVRGVCCPYINCRPPETKTAGKINLIYNKLFEKAASDSRDPGKRKNIRLYCSDIREECHWICIGNEMHVADWHEPTAEDPDTRPTVIFKGEGVAAFVREEFDRVLKRLAGYWALEGNTGRFNEWLHSGDTENREVTDDEVALMLDAAMGNESSITPEIKAKLPKGFYELLFGDVAEYRVPYLRFKKAQVAGSPGDVPLFEYKTTDQINGMFFDRKRELCPPSVWDLITDSHTSE